MAQSVEILKATEIPPHTQISQDRKGQLYLSNQSATVYRLDSAGTPDLIYAPERVAEVSNLEAQSGLRIFLFYREQQSYTFLDRFLTFKSQHYLPQDEIGFAQALTLSADNNLWIFDNSRFSLKKYNPQANFVLIDTPLDLILDFKNYAITQMREYQNRLYMLNDKKEILVFDNLGNFQESLVTKGWRFFGFHKENIFGITEGKLNLIDLYKDQESRSFALPEGIDWEYILPSKDEKQWIGFDAHKMYVLTFAD